MSTDPSTVIARLTPSAKQAMESVKSGAKATKKSRRSATRAWPEIEARPAPWAGLFACPAPPAGTGAFVAPGSTADGTHRVSYDSVDTIEAACGRGPTESSEWCHALHLRRGVSLCGLLLHLTPAGRDGVTGPVPRERAPSLWLLPRPPPAAVLALTSRQRDPGPTRSYAPRSHAAWPSASPSLGRADPVISTGGHVWPSAESMAGLPGPGAIPYAAPDIGPARRAGPQTSCAPESTKSPAAPHVTSLTPSKRSKSERAGARHNPPGRRGR